MINAPQLIKRLNAISVTCTEQGATIERMGINPKDILELERYNDERMNRYVCLSQIHFTPQPTPKPSEPTIKTLCGVRLESSAEIPPGKPLLIISL